MYSESRLLIYTDNQYCLWVKRGSPSQMWSWKSDLSTWSVEKSCGVFIDLGIRNRENVRVVSHRTRWKRPSSPRPVRYHFYLSAFEWNSLAYVNPTCYFAAFSFATYCNLDISRDRTQTLGKLSPVKNPSDQHGKTSRFCTLSISYSSFLGVWKCGLAESVS